MKRLIAILALIPLLGMGGGQSIVIKHKAASGGITIPLGSPVCKTYDGYTGTGPFQYYYNYTLHAAGDQILVGVSAGTNFTSVGDDKSDSVSTAVALTATYPGIYMITSATSGVSKIYVNTPSGGGKIVCILEASGIASIGNTNKVTMSAGTSYSTALSITQNNGYVFAVATEQSSGAKTPTATAGIVPAYYAASYSNIFEQYNTAATAGSVTISGTLSISGAESISIAELKY